MFDLALQVIQDEYNSFLLERTGSAAGRLQMGRVVDESGRCAIPPQSLQACLVNIRQDSALRNVPTNPRSPHGSAPVTLHVLFAANFADHAESLRSISSLMDFFGSHTLFSADQHPQLAPQIKQVAPVFTPLTYEEIRDIWSFLGARHMPSIVYAIRIIT